MINGETLIERTVRLLRSNGVHKRDIVITANVELADILNNPRYFEAPPAQVVIHANSYDVTSPNESTGYWTDCFLKTLEPATYLMGDVVFSPKAIKTIVKTRTKDIEFFASSPPFAPNYCKEWAEPFAFKVKDFWHLRQARLKTEQLAKEGAFKRVPIAWEFWQVVKGTELNRIDYTNYVAINDYTCDIDKPEDIFKFEGGEEWHII
jgi:hypothetical protein